MRQLIQRAQVSTNMLGVRGRGLQQGRSIWVFKLEIQRAHAAEPPGQNCHCLLYSTLSDILCPPPPHHALLFPSHLLSLNFAHDTASPSPPHRASTHSSITTPESTFRRHEQHRAAHQDR